MLIYIKNKDSAVNLLYKGE